MTDRWTAEVVYRTTNGPVGFTHDFEELEDLHQLVEAGPHWDTIIEIKVTLARPSEKADLTIEEAMKL